MSATGERGHRQGHRQIDHTADLALELWAPSEAALLVEGARAIVEILTGGPAAAAVPPATATRTVHIDAVDSGDRLVQWMNEVLVAAVTDGFLFVDADVALGTEDGARLDAEVHGGRAGHLIVTELKSVTYHDLDVADGAGGWRARVVIDV